MLFIRNKHTQRCSVKYNFIQSIFCVIFLSSCSQSSEMLFPRPSDLAVTFVEETQTWDQFPLDVLFVVESSTYLSSYQDMLVYYINDLLRSLYHKRQIIDVHIKITIASGSQGIEEFIDDSDFFTNETYADIFQGESLNLDLFKLGHILDLGTVAESQRFFDAVSRVVTLHQGNDAFYRNDAHLFIVLVGRQDHSQRFNASDLADQLIALKGNRRNKVTVLALQPPLNTECASLPLNDLREIDKFVERFSGIILPLCGLQSMELLQTAQDMIYQNTTRIPLNKIPILETARLCYRDYLIPTDMRSGWFYLPQENMLGLAKDLSLEESPFCVREEETIEQQPLFSLTYTSAIPSKERKTSLPEDLKQNEDRADNQSMQ